MTEPPPLTIRCPHCGIAIRYSLEIAGSESIECKNCRSSVSTSAAVSAEAVRRADATVTAMVESELADSCAGYLSRGRPLGGLAADELQGRWQAALRAFTNNRRAPAGAALDDCQAELHLRGLEPDMAPVQAELKRLTEMVRREFEKFPEGSPALRRKIRDYRRRSREKPN